MVADKEKELMDEPEAVRVEREGLEQEKEGLLQELESKNATITELEKVVASKENEIALLKQAVVESERKLTDINNTLAQAVASYKALVVKTNPEVLAELVTGDTIDAVNDSLENAKVLVERVKRAIEEGALKAKVPAGAPQRAPLDLSALSPREKIQYAIGGKR